MNPGSVFVRRYRYLIVTALCLAWALNIGASAAPHIDLNVVKGAARTEVVIVGTDFGSIQGTSNVTFNGTIGAPQSWSDTRIVVGVPEAATTGLVVVTVDGIASNGILFTVSGA